MASPPFERVARGTNRGGKGKAAYAGFKRSSAGIALRPLGLRCTRMSRLGYYPSFFRKRIDSPSLPPFSPIGAASPLARARSTKDNDGLARRLHVI